MHFIFKGFVGAAAAALFAVSAAEAGTVYSVSDDGGATFATVAPLATAETSSGFYNYANAIANPSFTLLDNAIHLFLHEDTTATGAASISLGMILTKTSGDLAKTVFHMSGAPAAAIAGVEDDPSDYFGWEDDGDVNGRYSMWWRAANRDGFTIDNLGASDWRIDIESDLLEGVSDVVFLTGDPMAPTMLSLSGLDNVAIVAETLVTGGGGQVAPVPLPAALPMLGAALAGLAGMRRFRRKA